jgi:hypothetical protein
MALDRTRYELEIEDRFSGRSLNEGLWIPHYLPHWSSREASAARYHLAADGLHLRIDADQEPWCPEFDGWLRVSSLQTGIFAGPLGSDIGQHRFRKELRVREEQESRMLCVRRLGLFEARVRAIADPNAMVALWMIGYEDRPERSGEICVFEIFGRDVQPQQVRVGMGIRRFGDPELTTDFARETLAIDAREPHTYAAEWTADQVAFHVDDQLVRTVVQSPTYPMQLMLDIYEFADGPQLRDPADRYPKEFVVEAVRVYRPK